MAALKSMLFSDNADLLRASHNSPPLRRGGSGAGVRALQFALVALGFDLPISVKSSPLSADGIFGAETEEAVRQFQKSSLLAVDGVAGAQTLSKIDQQLVATDCDPLGEAFYDLKTLAKRIGADVIQGRQATDMRSFATRLADASALVTGEPARFLVRMRRDTNIV